MDNQRRKFPSPRIYTQAYHSQSVDSQRRKFLKEARSQKDLPYGETIKITLDLSSQTMQKSTECSKIFKMVKEKNPPTYKSVSSKIILQKWSNKEFLRQKLREFFTSEPALLAWSIKRNSSERGEMATVRNSGLHIQRKNMKGREVK